jgi:hypothetical protein
MTTGEVFFCFIENGKSVIPYSASGFMGGGYSCMCVTINDVSFFLSVDCTL